MNNKKVKFLGKIYPKFPKGKKGTEWTVGKLLALILAVILIVLVIWGWTSGAMTPLKNKVTGMWDSVLIMFGYKSAGGNAGLIVKDVNVDGVGAGKLTINPNDGECKIDYNNGAGSFRINFANLHLEKYYPVTGLKTPAKQQYYFYFNDLSNQWYWSLDGKIWKAVNNEVIDTSGKISANPYSYAAASNNLPASLITQLKNQGAEATISGGDKTSGGAFIDINDYLSADYNNYEKGLNAASKIKTQSSFSLDLNDIGCKNSAQFFSGGFNLDCGQKYNQYPELNLVFDGNNIQCKQLELELTGYNSPYKFRWNYEKKIAEIFSKIDSSDIRLYWTSNPYLDSDQLNRDGLTTESINNILDSSSFDEMVNRAKATVTVQTIKDLSGKTIATETPVIPQIISLADTCSLDSAEQNNVKQLFNEGISSLKVDGNQLRLSQNGNQILLGYTSNDGSFAIGSPSGIYSKDSNGNWNKFADINTDASKVKVNSLTKNYLLQECR